MLAVWEALWILIHSFHGGLIVDNEKSFLGLLVLWSVFGISWSKWDKIVVFFYLGGCWAALDIALADMMANRVYHFGLLFY